MANAVILTAHGKYAEGLKSGLDLVLGPMDNIKVVNFEEGQGYQEIDLALEEAFQAFSEYKNVLFITDLKGGTPFNRSVMNFGDKENVRVLSGLNFGLAYQAAISQEEDINLYLEEVLETGKESIDYFAVVETTEEDDMEDGI